MIQKHANRRLIRQAIERTKQEIANPRKTWGTHGETWRSLNGETRSEEYIVTTAYKRLEVLMFLLRGEGK